MLRNTKSTKVKIAFVSDKYHWSSYSVVRSLYEELSKYCEVVYVWEDIIPDDVELILLVGANSKTMNPKCPVVRIGLSDPNLYSYKQSIDCDLRVTNDYRISTMTNDWYMPCFADKNYFKKLDVEKETDILFVGVKHHPYIQNRAEIVSKLRKQGLEIKTFGHNWNEGFIEGDRLVEEYNKAHLCLDLTNDTTALGSRIFQSSMCGTPVITKNRKDVLQLFNENEEIFIYEDFADLVNYLEYLKQMPDRVLRIGKRARQRCLKEHDVSTRVKGLLEHINDKGLLRPIRITK
jgi:spore maturation protein CgeB